MKTVLRKNVHLHALKKRAKKLQHNHVVYVLLYEFWELRRSRLLNSSSTMEETMKTVQIGEEGEDGGKIR
ncbi:hypothetical protein KSP40_PGU017933 [Platanthera guangdongensis]|uniref:Uncharacterized protein n=1 Tax=Platanthera guangdongensis TaxID=2320717 RepID=A0ABR2MZ87_9ASPA